MGRECYHEESIFMFRSTRRSAQMLIFSDVIESQIFAFLISMNHDFILAPRYVKPSLGVIRISMGKVTQVPLSKAMRKDLLPVTS